MMRTRLVWFTSGFIFNGAAIAYFLHRDLSRDHSLLLEQFEHNFGALEARVSNLESVPNTSISQVLFLLFFPINLLLFLNHASRSCNFGSYIDSGLIMKLIEVFMA